MREFGMMMMRRRSDDHDHHHHHGDDDDDEEELEEEEKREEGMMKPAWLEGLMCETFFAACGFHENRRKNEKNIFCLDCCQSFCPHCLPSHRSHPLLQVRRYVYQDVIRLDDLEKLIDCSYIQPYTINSAKVIFLNQRAQSRSGKSSGNACFTCDRILQEPFNFCSLSCKVDYMVYHGENLSSILYKFEVSEFSFSQFEKLHMDGCTEPDQPEPELIFDYGQITPNSILEDPLMDYDRNTSTVTTTTTNNNGNNSTSFSTSANISGRQDNNNNMGMGKKKKKKGNGFLPAGIMMSLSNRRKGAPHRSPLS